MSKPQIIFGVCLITIGMILLMFVFKWFWRGIYLKKFGKKTAGKVIEYKIFSEHNRNKGKALIIEVECESQKFTFTSSSYWINPPYSLGAKIPIVYRRFQGVPVRLDAALDTFEELFTDCILLGGVALALLTMGSLVIGKVLALI